MIIDQIFSFKQAVDRSEIAQDWEKKCNYFVLNPEISISLKIIPLLAFRSDHWVNLANGCFSQIIDQKLSFTTFLEKKYSFLKVRLFQKDFLVSSNSPKKRTNEFVVVVKTNLFVRFLGEFEDIKSLFEIIWPLRSYKF